MRRFEENKIKGCVCEVWCHYNKISYNRDTFMYMYKAQYFTDQNWKNWDRIDM